jgi:Glycosyl transferase family 2
MMPHVTVIVAAYQAGDYLREAIASGLAQTFHDIEILVSDDAADPAVEAMVRSFGDTRLRYRANSSRLGAAGNHWEAFRTARGEWLAILNHDDRWEPTYIEKVILALSQSSDAVLGFCDHFVIDSKGDFLSSEADAISARYGRDKLVAGRQISFPALVVAQTIPMAMGSVFLKSALDLETLPANAGPAYDLWLTYLLARTGGAAVYVPERLTSWRTHNSNLTSAGGHDWLAGGAECWTAMASDPMFIEFREVVQRRAAAAHRATAFSYLKNGFRSSARSAALRSLRICPANLKSMAAIVLSALPRKFSRQFLLKY